MNTTSTFTRPIFSTPFPWRSGNQFYLHIDGQRFFPRMLEAIHSATQSIALEMYLCSSGQIFNQFRDALIDATRRGVKVRMLLDGYGSLQVLQTDREQLLQAGVELKFFNPIRLQQGLKNLLRNHRKSLIIDQQIAFTGGAGLTDAFAIERVINDQQHESAWHDVMVEVQGSIARDWQLLFDHTWNSLNERLVSYRPIRLIAQASHLAKDHSPSLGRVVTSYGPQAHHVLQSLYERMKHAQRRAWLITPYFVPSWKLRQRLINAAKRGIDTRILVPGKHTDHTAVQQASRRYYARLLRHGVRIFEFQSRFIHAKAAVCDDWISIGSTNFDRWNVRWNLDANQEVTDINFSMQLVTMLDADFADSIELQQQDWLQRSRYQRSMEWLSGLLERWSGWLK